MPEPTVQVPVSLIERARRLVVEAHKWGDVARGNRVGGVGNLDSILADIEALLSLPTPTTEPPRLVTDQDVQDAQALLDQAHAETVPPTIADMAPGTTFTEVVQWTVHRDACSGLYARRATEHASERYLDGFDPSTIRDVQLPKEGARG